MIICRTLGPVEMSVDGQPAPPELLWRKHLALLIYLARSPRNVRERDHLVGLLWGDRAESAARHSLSEALRVIRRHAGEQSLDVTVGQVRLAAGTVSLDVDRLEELAAAGDWTGATALITGDFLEGFAVPGASAFEDWLEAEREGWRRRSVEILVRAAESLAGNGRAPEAATLALRALGMQPASEPAVRSAVRCLALAGDRAGALEAFERFRSHLADTLGAEPAAETRALIERVRQERAPPPAVRAALHDGQTVGPPPLVGRGRELQQMVEAAARAREASRAVLIALDGASGLGKTRLLSEFLTRLRLDGTGVVSARAVEADLAEPWSGVLALARGGLLDAPGIGAASASAHLALGRIIPEWAERFPGAQSAGITPAPLGRAFVELLRAAVGERPVVIAVDDAQWIDPDSARAIGTALRDLASLPVVAVLALAPFPPRAELDELRTRIGRDLDGETVRLRGLDAVSLRALAERMLPGYDPVAIDRVVRRVATDSAGMPLLAAELLRAVTLGLDLGTIAGAWPEPLRTLDQTLPGELPDAVVAAIRIGVRRLSPTAQRVLAAAAVLGDLAPPRLIERALALGPEEVGPALDELEWHGWLVAEPRGYSFVARVVRRVIERDMLTPGQRRRVLQAAGRTE